MPSLTYRRMSDIAAWLDLTPRFCDIDFDSFSLQRYNVEKCINENTAIVVAPHPIVNICDVKGIEDLCREKKIPLLFDSVESYYAEINNKKIGGFGDVECFSLHASKFINGFEGGYITTNNRQIANKISQFLKGGLVRKNKIIKPGIKLNLPNYHAALALSSLYGIKNNLITIKKYTMLTKIELDLLKGLN